MAAVNPSLLIMSQFVILGVKDRDETFRDLVKMKRPIQIQIIGEKLKTGKVTGATSDSINFRLPHVERFEGSYEAIVSFSLPPDVFFLKTSVTGAGEKFSFGQSEEVFRLQRRDTFRLSIPDRVTAKVKFLNHKIYNIHDLSQGGFSIELPAQDSDIFVTGTYLDGDIEISGEVFKQVLCEAKHARVQPSAKTKVLVGFQFLKLTSKQEEILFRLLTDIARTHFR